MRWLAVVLLVPLVACDARVIVTRTPSPTAATSSPGASSSPSSAASTTAPKVALRSVPSVTPASRLVSLEQAGDIAVAPRLRFLLTDDGRVLTLDSGGQLQQRRLTPNGAAAMLLQAIQTGFFAKDEIYPRVPVPGTTPPGRGPTFFILVVANAGREVRVSFEPTGQPDDEQYQKSATREKLTALARGYDDLSWVAASQWAEPTAQPYRPALQRVFILAQPNLPPGPVGSASDADAVWPFLTAIDGLGEPMSGTLWKCAVVIDDDARVLTDALNRAGAATRDGATITAALPWHATGSVRFGVTPLLPHEPATCAGAVPPFV